MRKSRIPELTAEIREEIGMLDSLVEAVTSVTMPEDPDSRIIYRESLALKIHNFYTGCERIFCKIASELDGGVPRSHDWHRRLLLSMSLELEDVRPAVISKSTAREFNDYLSFRHVIRNIYGFEIEERKLLPLISRLPVVWKQAKTDFHRFLDMVVQIGKS